MTELQESLIWGPDFPRMDNGVSRLLFSIPFSWALQLLEYGWGLGCKGAGGIGDQHCGRLVASMVPVKTLPVAMPFVL